MSFNGHLLQSLYAPDKKTSEEAINNSGANNVQLALNPVTKEIVSPECDESRAGAGSTGLIVSDSSNKIKSSSESYYVNNNILQATKSTVIEEKTIPETVNVISPGTGFKEQAEKSTVVKQEGQIKNSNFMFCTDKSKVRLKKSNLKISYNCKYILYIFCSQREF